MCGICGLYTSNVRQEELKRTIQTMNSTLVHRGMDEEGYFISENLALGIRRLAIIDIASGQQPLTNEDRTITLVYNGEIYNFQELRSELENLGHHFHTRSDGEVIIHAYESWGDDCLLRFNGMFALALWDEVSRRLLIARDRMGKKPLYWHFGAQGLVFASEAKALLAVPWMERKLERTALHHYLTLQYAPDPLTFFRGMYQLPAAHKLVYTPGEQPVVTRWWQLNFLPKWKISAEEAISAGRDILSRAVERRMISEAPLGAFLSGGIDSSIVVALMAECSTQPVKTFTIGFGESRYSENQYSRYIADRYATEHHELVFSPEQFLQSIETMISVMDEPLADAAIFPLNELARQARQTITVALCGDGGDETLAGYPRYGLDGILAPYAWLPKALTTRAMPWLAEQLAQSGLKSSDHRWIAALRRLERFARTSPKASLVRWGSYFNHEDKLALYSPEMSDRFQFEDTAELLAEFYDQANAHSRLDRTLYADHQTYLAGDLLPKTDRVSMAHSLEVRSPFLDVEWVEWTARLPEFYKVRELTTKWLMKELFVDKLPESILKRSKQGFHMPVDEWLRGELKLYCKERLTETAHFKTLFRPTVIQKLLDDHQNGKSNHGKRLWALLIFALWLEKNQFTTV